MVRSKTNFLILLLNCVAYFTHVASIYPILDESLGLDRSALYAPATVEGNSLTSQLLRMIVCTGAACMNDRDSHGNDIKYMRESLFSQVLSEAFLIHSNFGIVNVQIMVLIVRLASNLYK
jgi:hypothetical protein